MELSIENYITHHYPQVESIPVSARGMLYKILKKVFHEEQINDFLVANRQKDSFAFIEAILDYFDVDIALKKNELNNIPSYGRVVVVANHPLGTLDALALIHLIKDIRKDIKIVANSFLQSFENLSELLIPVDNINDRVDKESLKSIYKALSNEQVVIIFPAGGVSRVRPNGVKDTKWKRGFYKIATKMQAPLLPIHIVAKNSKNFYLLSMINRSLATATLPHEMFKFQGKNITFTIGNTIPYKSYHIPALPMKESIKLLRKHFYRVAKGKKGVFETQNQIAHAEAKIELKSELKNGKELGETKDGKKIILYETQVENAILKEIGRLREISFREVGEGSGKKRDIDYHDFSYKHLIVWDNEALEIAGAYRIGLCRDIIDDEGIEGLYTSSLFTFEKGFDLYFERGIELGRSFVQPKYWNSRALDYLWQGIGAYIRNYPQIRYLFGPVTLSNALSTEAKELLIFFYQHYFGAKEQLVKHKEPYIFADSHNTKAKALFCGVDYRADLRILREELAVMGFTIPTLYKQYSEICEEGGVEFMDFGYDHDFNDCIDGFIVCDMDRLKAAKRKRYIGE